MSNVSFSIGGRRFTVACAPGEEAHVAALGRTIDARVAALGGVAGQSETRMLLFAALMLADEVHEQQRPAEDPALAARLAGMADALEKLAERLEGSSGGA